MTFVWLYGLGLVWILSALSYIDLKTYRLPNGLTALLILLGLSFNYVYGDLNAAAIGMVAGYILFLLVELGFKYARGIDGLGRGDAKLLAGGGAWCGWMYLPQIILIASASAIFIVLIARLKRKDINSPRLRCVSPPCRHAF